MIVIREKKTNNDLHFDSLRQMLHRNRLNQMKRRALDTRISGQRYYVTESRDYIL